MPSISGISNPMIQQLAQQSSSMNMGGSSNIGSLGSIQTLDASSPASSSQDSFGSQLMDVMNQVNETQHQAAQKETDFMTGQREVDYHDLMISMEKASISLQLATNVRDKLLEAYQSLSSMQV